MVNAEKAADSMINIYVGVTVISALIGLVLSGFLNLSGEVTVLAILFSSVLGILLTVGIYKAVSREIKSMSGGK